MESLSSVATIVRIAQDIAGAVATVSRNRSRCRKLSERVQGIGDLLRELHVSEAEGAGTTDAATGRLLGRLEDALHRALQLVLSCRDSSYPRSLLAGGRLADRFDEVDGEINRCLLDLGVANRILIARIEKLLLHQHQNAVRCCDLACSTETVTLRVGMPCDDSTDHELVPPPSNGHWPYAQGIGTGGCYHDGAGAPSNAAAYYHHDYSSYLDMFNDENPNACSII